MHKAALIPLKKIENEERYMKKQKQKYKIEQKQVKNIMHGKSKLIQKKNVASY